MSRLPRALALLAVAACAPLAAAGCGGASGGDGGADPASVVPATAPLFVSITVRPEGETKANIERIAKTLFGTDDPGGALVDAIEKQGDGPSDLDFEQDVEPWLGDRVGIAVTRAQGADADTLIVAASKDNAKAEEALGASKDLPEEGSYRDTSYRRSADGATAAALIEDTVAVGSEQAVRQAIDVSLDDRALADQERFKQAASQVPANGLATGYVDVKAFVKAAATAGGQGANAQVLQSLVGGQASAIAASLEANADNLRLEAVTTGASAAAKAQTGDDAAGAVAALPADAWLGIGLGDIGTSLESAITQFGAAGGLGAIGPDVILDQVKAATGLDVREDLLAWMGSGAIFVEGTSLGDVGGGLVVASKDPAATRSAVRRLERVLPRLASGARVRPLTARGVDQGFTLSSDSGAAGGLSLYVAAADERFVLAVGQTALRDALAADGTLGDTAGYQNIAPDLGDQQKPTFYMDLDQVAALVENVGGSDPQAAKLVEVLRKLTQVAAGGRQDGDTSRVSVVVGVDEG